MKKELEAKLFNIYDIVVFGDEDGIAQDCVCSIVKSKSEDVIECNNYRIYIYGKDKYEVWERGSSTYTISHKKIIHLFTLKNDNRFYQIYPRSDYASLNNTNKEFEILNKLISFEGYVKVDMDHLIGGDYDKDKFIKKTYDNLCDCSVDLNDKTRLRKALIKLNEQEKALKIIFEKHVDIDFLESASTFEEYNKLIQYKAPFSLDLTEEEFRLLRRYMLNEQ